MVGCELGGGKEVFGGGGGGGAIDVIGIVVVYQLKALDLHLNNIISPTPVRRTRHFLFFWLRALVRSDKETVAAKKIRQGDPLHVTPNP